MIKPPLETAFKKLADFSIDEVDKRIVVAKALKKKTTPVAAPTLGALANFQNTFTGTGFNTIFRPDSSSTPTPMPGPITTSDPADNVLELNLTEETLSFSPSLGSIPNRGSNGQADAFLNGVPYLQSINDVTSGAPIGIHFEPGIWLAIPATTSPTEPATIARMASIPHGATIVAQGVALPPFAAGPVFNPIDITPFFNGNPATRHRFQNQDVPNVGTRRIPQDLTALNAAGKITQPILDNPALVLANQVAGQTITQTIALFITTRPGAPIPKGPLDGPGSPFAPDFGGGTSNIAFLMGEANPPPGGAGSNANSVRMDAVFWIETVVYDIDVPPFHSGTFPIKLDPVQKGSVPLTPTFVVSGPFHHHKHFPGGTVKVATTQIQYAQMVLLDFNGLTWPHVSVASLVPADPIPIPHHLLHLV